MTPSLSALKFEFQVKEKDNMPSNCPPVIDTKTGKVINENNALKEYDLLGFFPAYKILSWGFRDNPNFEWKTYWENQCSLGSKGKHLSFSNARNSSGSPKFKASIDPMDLVDQLDKMQKKNLGDLPTGATTIMGLIGQKALRDVKMAKATNDKNKEKENLELATKIYDTLTSFEEYIKEGMKSKTFPESKKGVEACQGIREKYCKDSLSRVYLGVGRMTTAAIDSGFTEGNVDPNLVKKKKRGNDLGASDIKKDVNKAYKTGAEKLYSCVLEFEDDSLERDQCLEMIKNVAGEGIKNEYPAIYNDALDFLGSWYTVKKGKEGKKELDNVATWVNSTVWMADALIEGIEMEHFGTISQEDPGVTKIINTIQDQKKEKLKEFSTADWITQQVLIITGERKIYDRHGEIIKKINRDRLSKWNKWLDHYIDTFSDCPDDAGSTCMTEEANDALRELANSINRGCLFPIMDKERKGKELTTVEKESIKTCSGAIGKIIEKSNDEKGTDASVLKMAMQPYFMWAQDDGGIHYNETVKNELMKSIKNRFTAKFARTMTGSMGGNPKNLPGGGRVEPFIVDMLRNQTWKAEKGKEIKANYMFEITTVGGKPKDVEIIRIEE